ncbi:MAG: hypothetical protein WHT46_05805, partial [Candidatus Geothermincolales bacterium]
LVSRSIVLGSRSGGKMGRTVVERIKRIREAETRSQGLVEEAGERARQMVQQARVEARRVVEQAEEAARKEGQALFREAVEEASREAERVRKEAEEQRREYLGDSEEGIRGAAHFLLERLRELAR